MNDLYPRIVALMFAQLVFYLGGAAPLILVPVLVVWGAVLTEMAAPTGRQVTALPHGFRDNGRTGPGNIRF